MIRKLHGIRHGGSVNLYVHSLCKAPGLFLYSKLQMWETAERAGVVTANMMW